MKTITVALFLLTTYFNLQGQITWFEKGEVFTYFVRKGFSPSGIDKITVLGDTLIRDTLMKNLKYEEPNGYSFFFQTYQDGNKIYKNTANRLKLEYDFSYPKMDSIFILNKWRKIIKVGDSSYQIEGIGNVGSLNVNDAFRCSPFIPSWKCTGYVDGYDYYFRCMESKGNTYSPYGTCIVSNEDLTQEANTMLFPNPINDRFEIITKKPINHVVLLDVLGNEITKYLPTENYYTLPTNLTHSIYLVMIKYKSGETETIKLNLR